MERRAVHAARLLVPLLALAPAGAEDSLQVRHVKEALESARAHVERYPDDGLPRIELSRAYLSAGLVEPAREAAQEAVRLQPDRASFHREHGIALAHDLVGRPFAPGADLAGAEAALRRAEDLDPLDKDTLVSLAELLERGADGTYASAGARPGEAAERYRVLVRDLGLPAAAPPFLRALAQAGRFEEIRELGPGLPASAPREVAIVAAIAVLEGPGPARAEAERRATSGEGADASGLRTGAALLLASCRRYPEAAALLAEGTPQEEGLGATLGGLRRREEIDMDPADPASVIPPLVAAVLTAGAPGQEAFGRLVSRRIPERGAALEPWRRMLAERLDPATGLGLEGEARLDLAVAACEVRGRPVGEAGHAMLAHNAAYETGLPFFVLAEDEGPRLLPPSPQAVGRWARDLLRQGDAGAAWTALQLVLPDRVPEDPVERPLLTAAAPDAVPPVEHLEALAASLRAGSPEDAAEARAVLEGHARTLPRERRREVAPALLRTHLAQDDWARAVRLARGLVRDFPESPSAREILAETLRRAGRGRELERWAAARLRTDPADPVALRARALQAEERGDAAAAVAAYDALVASPRSEPGDRNNLAWLLLREGLDRDRAVTLAREAVEDLAEEESELGAVAARHTLACLLADAGDVAGARAALARLVDAQGRWEPADWLVPGILAERLDLPELAARYYDRVVASPGDPDDSAAPFALRRKAALAR